MIEDDDLLEIYNTIWDKVSADIKKEFDSEPVYNKEFLKAKIKSHGDEVTDFYDKKIPKADSNHTCLAVISLDSALKKDENYYPLECLKECKYTEKKVNRHINGNLSEFCSFDESDEEFRRINWSGLIFLLSQLPLNLITPRGLPVIENLQSLIRVYLLIIVRRRIFFCSFKRTLGIQQIFTATGL